MAMPVVSIHSHSAQRSFFVPVVNTGIFQVSYNLDLNSQLWHVKAADRCRRDWISILDPFRSYPEAIAPNCRWANADRNVCQGHTNNIQAEKKKTKREKKNSCSTSSSKTFCWDCYAECQRRVDWIARFKKHTTNMGIATSKMLISSGRQEDE